jgi:hypothetical protein
VAAGWGDSNSGPPRKVLLGRGGAAELTCDFIWPRATTRARCTPLPAGFLCAQRVPRVPMVSGSSGRGRLGRGSWPVKGSPVRLTASRLAHERRTACS